MNIVKMSMAAALCFVAAMSVKGEDHVVIVNQGETNRIDAAFVRELGEKNLVKRGRGVLWSSSAMADYSGEITVEEGALMVSSSKDLGTGAGSTIISNGATIIIFTGDDVLGSATSGGLMLPDSVVVGGAGDEQWGAAIFQPEGGFSQQKAFGSAYGLVLTADTVVRAKSGLGITGSAISMNGNSLTVSGVFAVNRSRIIPATAGDIEIDGGTLVFNAFVSGDFGSPEKKITVRSGAQMQLYDSEQIPLWKLVLDEGSHLVAAGNKTGDGYNIWGGDVEWNTSTNVNAVSHDGVSLHFKGNVSGSGVIRSVRGKLVFEKECSVEGGLVLSDTEVTMKSANDYWGHGGMMIGYRTDGWNGGFDSNRPDTEWMYCPTGPGPQSDRSYWHEGIGKNEAYCSRGFIWNRESTNVTYIFRVGCMYNNYVYTNGVLFKQYVRDDGKTYPLTLNPGPTAIDIRTVAGGDNVFGGPRSDSDRPKWRIDASTPWIFLEDPGNGFLFTTDTVSRAEVMMENRSVLSCLDLSGGTIIDCRTMPVMVKNLTGFSEITNVMSVTVSESWTLPAADIIAGKFLKVYGNMNFESGVNIDVSELKQLPHLPTSSYIVCRAEKITGFPESVEVRSGFRRWLLNPAEDGKTITLDYAPAGFSVILR